MVSGHSTHWTIIRGAAEGRRAEQAEFARQYGPVIRAYLGARWSGTSLRAEVEDGEQQVFLDCFKPGGALARADPAREGGFSAYLYGVVRNVARAVERKHARTRERQAESGVLEGAVSDEDSLARVFDRAWATALLRNAAELYRRRAEAEGEWALRRHQLLSLRYGENLPIREIAARWGVDASELHREATRARQEFRAALTDVVRDLNEAKDVERVCDRLFDAFF